MSDLRDLYQEVILDHNRSPRNFGALPQCDRKAAGHNPLCGDVVTVYLTIADGRVSDLRFEGKGCAISVASASIMTELIKGRTVAEARAVFARFRGVVTDAEDAGETPDQTLDDDLDKLQVLSGVREFPMRVKCATLAWHTLAAALDDKGETVVTE
ncbi:MAG: SUF system NifU family Fe-S cluster assembly protein [Alphaproteobacteria bacterium]|jgi:nitrogen fixation NifU-like protein|nr:SUF system NifU family Fe-S cluster assembly protein [Alphaproteobacteria bacterium]